MNCPYGIAASLALLAMMGRIKFFRSLLTTHLSSHTCQSNYSQFANLTEYTALISGSIYPQLVPMKVLQHTLTIAVISALAALYPAIQASRREPAEALHYV